MKAVEPEKLTKSTDRPASFEEHLKIRRLVLFPATESCGWRWNRECHNTFHTRNNTGIKTTGDHSGDSSAKNSSRNSKRYDSVRIVTFETSSRCPLMMIEHQSRGLGQISFFLPSRRSSRRRFTLRQKASSTLESMGPNGNTGCQIRAALEAGDTRHRELAFN